jgi:hypothetical protein
MILVERDERDSLVLDVLVYGRMSASLGGFLLLTALLHRSLHRRSGL